MVAGWPYTKFHRYRLWYREHLRRELAMKGIDPDKAFGDQSDDDKPSWGISSQEGSPYEGQAWDVEKVTKL